jgi:hypothetical protein
MQQLDMLMQELEPTAVKLKTMLFPEGCKFGFLPLITGDAKYGKICGDPKYQYDRYHPVPLDNYDMTIDVSMSDVVRKQKEAVHDDDWQKLTDWGLGDQGTRRGYPYEENISLFCRRVDKLPL